jgi:hypothetical protein
MTPSSEIHGLAMIRLIVVSLLLWKDHQQVRCAGR